MIGIYDFGPNGQTFGSNITIRMEYDPDSIPEGIDPSDLRLAYLSDDGTWEVISDSTVDTTNHIITGSTNHFSTYSAVINTKAAHGIQVGEFNSVIAYSNGSTDYNNKNTQTNHSYNGTTTGLEWECVEYINRYYLQHYGKDIRGSGGHAKTYYDTAENRGLVAYPNDGSEPPRAGDIIVSEYGSYGHVAIVREVTSNYIYVIHQNFLENSADNRYPLAYDSTRNHISAFNKDGRYAVKGWLRLPLSTPIIELVNSLVWIPAGSFMMGSEDNEYGYAQYTTPVHEVTLSGFFMGAFEVTQAQYKVVMGTNPSYFQESNGYTDTENYPVELVTWYDAREFCDKLSDITGWTFTLPSEAQWEYACRAGTTTLYSWGDSDSLIGDYAWWWENSDGTGGPYGTHPVGTRLPNPWGLYDIQGNVWEWCLDSWHSNYNGAPTDGSAWEPDTGSDRMFRGGSWYDVDPWDFRSAVRDYYDSPGGRFTNIGFRVLAVR